VTQVTVKPSTFLTFWLLVVFLLDDKMQFVAKLPPALLKFSTLRVNIIYGAHSFGKFAEQYVNQVARHRTFSAGQRTPEPLAIADAKYTPQFDRSFCRL
jgi:hypothetical protein